MTYLWLTVPEAAERLHIAESTLRRLIREGHVPHRRIGRRIRISERRLAEWADGDGDVRAQNGTSVTGSVRSIERKA